MTELLFMVEEEADGGFVASAVGESIVTEGDTIEELRKNVRDAVSCHFDDADLPAVIRLHFVRDEVMSL